MKVHCQFQLMSRDRIWPNATLILASCLTHAWPVPSDLDLDQDPEKLTLTLVRAWLLALQTIEHYGSARPGFGSFALDADDDGCTSVASAQAIIKRLRKRDLYKFVDEFLVPQADLSNGT